MGPDADVNKLEEGGSVGRDEMPHKDGGGCVPRRAGDVSAYLEDFTTLLE